MNAGWQVRTNQCPQTLSVMAFANSVGLQVLCELSLLQSWIAVRGSLEKGMVLMLI